MMSTSLIKVGNEVKHVNIYKYLQHEIRIATGAQTHERIVRIETQR